MADGRSLVLIGCRVEFEDADPDPELVATLELGRTMMELEKLNGSLAAAIKRAMRELSGRHQFAQVLVFSGSTVKAKVAPPRKHESANYSF